ncbi:peptidoglycan DD-metalloendopeptidase family protein [Brevibacillus sp. SYSU BS000544]|uniref:peptidoglycan DD-metalloendopeptidase family protein n=1 Tax=Brevibacillus sp. SYSU BS000544 TaxID=3416443 RepID=UPI003CE4DDAC
MIPMMKEYRVSSLFGRRTSPITGKQEFHTGIDLVKAPFSPIKAFVSGTVVHAKVGQRGTGVGGFGVIVIIKDKFDHLHLYAHLTDSCVSLGEQVQAGQVIGRQGSTGQSTGQHLHYEVRKYGQNFGFGNHIDPVKYLDEYEIREQKSHSQVQDQAQAQTQTQEKERAADRPDLNTCNVELNGKRLNIKGVIDNGKSLIPVRSFAKEINKESLVEFCAATKKILLINKALTSTKLIGDTGYAWIKEIADVLGYQVEWDNAAKTVKLKESQ